MRKLKFDLNVQTNALVCPNPQEFYSKSYITENVVDNFRTIPGVKNKTKIARNAFADILNAASCSWAAVDTTLDAVDIEVCSIDAMVQICQYDIETSFVSLMMAKGDANWEVASFMSHYWEEMAKEIEAEVQDIRWNGDTAGSTGTYLDLCDGYLKALNASLTVVKTNATGAFTKANIIDNLELAVAGLKEETKNKKADLRIYMSASSALIYTQATLGLNNNFNYTGDLPLQYAGYKIAVQEGMPADTLVVTSKNNMVYAFDGEADSTNLKAVNLSETTAEPVIRTRASMKIGFQLLNEDEISFVGIGITV